MTGLIMSRIKFAELLKRRGFTFPDSFAFSGFWGNINVNIVVYSFSVILCT